MNNVNSNPIVNGLCKSNTGYRQVLLNSHYELRPVLFKVCSGYIPDRSSRQVSPKKGDLLFKSEWGSKWDEYSFKVFDGSSFIEVLDANVNEHWCLAEKKHPWLKDFLKPHQPRSTSFIPWEAETLSEKAKRRKFLNFCDDFKLPLFVRELEEKMITSPKRGLNYDPVPAGDILDHVPEWTTSDGVMVGVDRKEYFYSWDGKWSALVDVCYNETHRCMSNHIPDVVENGKPLRDSLSVYPNTKVIIKITIGAYTKDHYSYGVAIDVFKL